MKADRLSHLRKPNRESGVLTTGLVCALTSLIVGSVGCATSSFSDVVVGPNFVPQNVHRLNARLPAQVRRLAVLPTTSAQATGESAAGLQVLHPVLLDEVTKTRKFEVIVISPELLRRWTGKASWNTEETLPSDLFQILKHEAGCDAVLFSRLSVFHPYPPLAVGWNLKIVEVEDGKLLWAADEVIDSADERVVNAARRYQKTQERFAPQLADSRSILVSPERFGRYAATTILTSLPER